MTTLANPPLLEAIFEIRWGERSPGKFEYTPQEQNILPGLVTSQATKKRFKITEYLDREGGHGVAFPMQPLYRFRREQGNWPCLQLGLGIFTVNQIADGYDWEIFRKDIGIGYGIFHSAEPEVLDSKRKDATLILRYQDAFYPDQGMTAYDYIQKYFNITVSLPAEYTSSSLLSPDLKDIHFRFNTSAAKPIGDISISLVSAIIGGRPGLLMETIVQSNAHDVLSQYTTENLLEWADAAHDLQRHAFNSLVKKSSYSK
ncbi:MAG: TIGR04255 family protein [Gammaproteobacteria bacterium]|nr:TIGR04255 family protein [Gammaproteobacteria bacterium]